jgi:hypothetical protein
MAPLAAVVEAHRDDLQTLLPQIEEAMNDHPILAHAMSIGSPTVKAQALESLYGIAKSRHIADTSRHATAEAQIKTAQEAAQARADATVVSASQGSATSAPLTFEEQVRQGFVTAAREQGHMARDTA